MTQIAARWTKELDAILEAGLAAHKTLSQIALLTGRTKNSCCGRATRLREKAGLVPQRPTVGQKPAPQRNGHIDAALHYKIRQLTHSAPPRAPSQPLKPLTERFAEGYEGQIGRLSLMELREGVCRFPITPKAGPPVRYCGDPVAERSVYCPSHAARVRQYIPMSSSFFRPVNNGDTPAFPHTNQPTEHKLSVNEACGD